MFCPVISPSAIQHKARSWPTFQHLTANFSSNSATAYNDTRDVRVHTVPIMSTIQELSKTTLLHRNVPFVWTLNRWRASGLHLICWEFVNVVILKYKCFTYMKGGRIFIDWWIWMYNKTEMHRRILVRTSILTFRHRASSI